MPELLAALIAFVAEHERCGDLDGGLKVGIVRITCSCGAQIVQPATPSSDDNGPRPLDCEPSDTQESRS